MGAQLVIAVYRPKEGGEERLRELLAELLRHPPEGMQLVLVTRRDPLLPLAQLRAKGLMTEIRTEDLRFTLEEAAAFLRQWIEMPVDEATISLLERTTEGWVTGLRLAVLSMRHRGGLDPKLLAPQVDSQYVMEYLFTEVLSRQPPEIRQYLLGTAILDRFLHHAEIIQITGKSYRLKNGAARKTKTDNNKP